MARLVRRKPLWERVKANLDLFDWLLYLSEEFETSDWDTKNLGTMVGLGANFVYLLARANTGRRSKNVDDVFGDGGGAGWAAWFASFLVLILSAASISNAFYTFTHRRHYRLFEAPISKGPSTPNASRVRVDSSPSSASPLRFVQKVMYAASAASRAHPDATRDVWELAIWDPTPFCLTLFQFFSPGHVLVYWIFLPLASLDPRPSWTVFSTLLLQALLTAQTYFLIHNFLQQAKDTAVRNKEVMNEYDTKFVHPHTIPPVRDVGTQFSTSVSVGSGPDGTSAEEEVLIETEDISTSNPHTILKRGFKINPNPNYASHIAPDDPGSVPRRSVLVPNPQFPGLTTPAHQTQYTPSAYGRTLPAQTFGTDRRQTIGVSTATSSTPFASQPKSVGFRQPQFRPPTTSNPTSSSSTPYRSSQGDGGSLGIYTHANSPLKKTTNAYDFEATRGTPRNGREAARREIAEDRERERRRTEKVERGWGGIQVKRPKEEERRRTLFQ